MESTDYTVNILLATFAGLDLPRTLSLPTPASTSISHVYTTIFARLPVQDDRLLLTTVSNKQLTSSDCAPIATLLNSPNDSILSLRLSRRLCGGKGGFGSQLRAAGGRMSSRKNRNSNANPNGSNRNLDGRRLRTVDEAKRLADYLAIKPEMERKEKEEGKKRWQEVVETAERREEEIKSGKAGANKGRLNAEYVEQKEEAEEKTRQAVLKAMREGMLERTGSESSMEQDEGVSGDDTAESSASSEDAKVEASEAAGGRSFFGWDEDEEDDSEEDEADGEDREDEKIVPAAGYEGKGKGKATS